jgi:tetratricopeptide (TPR) repeat protein
MPLAIELAAARLKGLTVEQIAARLADQFNLLTSGRRTALPRHQTLRAAIDWSYDLLTAAERALLGRLAVFAGGWTLEAAEQLDNSTVQQARAKQDSTAASANLLDLLMQLVNKSLVLVTVQGAETRYRMLETIRAYALEKLTAQGELDPVCRQHALVYLALAEAAEPHLHGHQQAEWLDRLEREQNNFRAALTWCRGASGDVSLGLRLVAGLWQFWWFGHAHEGCRWLEEMLQAAPPDTPPRVRAQVLLGVGMLAVIRNEDLVKAAYFEEAAHLFRSLNEPAGLAVALQGAAVAKSRQDYPSATALVEESLALCRQLGYTWGANQALLTLGIVAKEQADYGRAIAIFTEVLAHFRQVDDGQGIASALNELASVAARQLDFARSCACAEESLQTARRFGARAEELNALMRLGDALRYGHDFARASTVLAEYHRLATAQDEQWHVITALMLLGKVAKDQGDHRKAIACFAQSMAVIRHLALFESLLCDNLEGMACVASAQGQFTRAARLFGAAEALHEMTHTPLFPQKRFEYAPYLAAVQERLGEGAFAVGWAEGQAMLLEQAVAYALEPGQS